MLGRDYTIAADDDVKDRRYRCFSCFRQNIAYLVYGEQRVTGPHKRDSGPG